MTPAQHGYVRCARCGVWLDPKGLPHESKACRKFMREARFVPGVKAPHNACIRCGTEFATRVDAEKCTCPPLPQFTNPPYGNEAP